METFNNQAAPDVAPEQGMSATPQRKGGFVKGAVVAQGCCGETNAGSSGCCGTPVQGAMPATEVQSTAQDGCCGAPAAITQVASASSGCCGEPASTSQVTSASSRCCG